MRAAISVSPSSVSISFIFCRKFERVPLPRGVIPSGGCRFTIGLARRPEHGALIDRRQETRAPARRAALRRPLGLRHHDVGRQILALAAQSVRDPRAHARIAHQDAPGIDLVHRRRVHSAVRIEAPHEAEIVHALRDVRKQRRYLASALPVLA